MRTLTLAALVATLLTLTACGSTGRAEPPSSRDISSTLRNDHAQFTVRSQRAGYLYLLYTPVSGKTKCLFPNAYDGANRIAANTNIAIPTQKQAFDFTCHGPFGDETLTAIVSENPLTPDQLGVASLTRAVATENDKETLAKGLKGAHGHKDMDPTPRRTPVTAVPAEKWAEHSVHIKTIPSPDQSVRIPSGG